MTAVLLESLRKVLLTFQPCVLPLINILLGAFIAHVIDQSFLKLQLRASQTRVWKILVDKKLAAISKHDNSVIGGSLHALRREVRNLRREKEGLEQEVRRLRLTKEDVEEQVLESELRSLERKRRGGHVAGGGQVPIAAAHNYTEKTEAALQARDHYNEEPYNSQLRKLRQEKKVLEDKYAEALRQLRNTQAASCPTCSLRSSLVCPLTFSIGIFDNDDPPHRDWDKPVTQSCCVPEPSPRNVDRHRRRITPFDPPGGEVGNVGDVDVDLYDSFPDDVDLDSIGSLPPSPDPDELKDYHVVQTPTTPGFGDFLFLDSYFDLEEFEPIDPTSDSLEERRLDSVGDS